MVTKIVLGILATLMLSEVHAGKPEVLVQFDVAVEKFSKNLPDLDQARLTVSKSLADELQRQFVFASWLVAPSTQPNTQLGRIVLKMEADDRTQPSATVYVKLWGASAAAGAELQELGFQQIDIYTASDINWATHDRRAFEARVVQKTMERVRNSAFAEEFFTKFIRRLPIARAVVLDANERVIEIPVQWNELLLAPESQLLVRFDKSAPVRQGTMTLGRIVPRLAEPVAAPAPFAEFPARLRGSVTEASFDTHPIVLNDNWSDQLQQILSDANASCYISVYKPRDELSGDADRFGL